MTGVSLFEGSQNVFIDEKIAKEFYPEAGKELVTFGISCKDMYRAEVLGTINDIIGLIRNLVTAGYIVDVQAIAQLLATNREVSVSTLVRKPEGGLFPHLIVDLADLNTGPIFNYSPAEKLKLSEILINLRNEGGKTIQEFIVKLTLARVSLNVSQNLFSVDDVDTFTNALSAAVSC